jgi:hypothetical protein
MFHAFRVLKTTPISLEQTRLEESHASTLQNYNLGSTKITNDKITFKLNDPKMSKKVRTERVMVISKKLGVHYA